MTLIDTTDALYVKRLARELNSQADGFYASVSTYKVRCNRARTAKGELQCHSFSCFPEWFVPGSLRFEDVYGREIVASRKLV